MPKKTLNADGGPGRTGGEAQKWHVDKNGGKHFDQLVIVDSDDYVVCGTVGHASISRCVANANLIAAAPELLAATKHAHRVLEQLGQESLACFAQLAQAIEKAEGAA